MINEKEEDDHYVSEKKQDPIVKRKFLSRGSGKAGGVGKPLAMPTSQTRPASNQNLVSPRAVEEENTTAFGKKSKSVGVMGRINNGQRNQTAMASASNSFVE